MGPEAGGRGEEDKANWLTGYLTEKGFPIVERLDSVERVQSMGSDAVRDVRPNIIVVHPGRYGLEKGRTLWILCHLHVAHPGPLELWNGSPWKLRVEGNTLYGRGVMDNYQSITASILLLDSLSRNKLTPALNLGLVLHAQNSGFRHVLQTRPDLFKQGDLYLVPDHGNQHGTAASLAEKGILWLKLTIQGEVRHASEGRGWFSALAAGSELIHRLPELGRDSSREDVLFADPAPTCTATQASTEPGGLNSVASSYTLHLDCRFTPSHDVGALEGSVRDLAASLDREHEVKTEVAVLLRSQSAVPTSPDSEIVRALRRAVGRQWPGKGDLLLQGSNTSTSASLLRERGLPVVAWAMINPDNRQIANEFAYIADHLDEARVFARILFDRDIQPQAAPAQP
jgi:succinyl-diaminopimelate desuccinylase